MAKCACVYCDEIDEEGHVEMARANLPVPYKCSECGREISIGKDVLVALCWDDDYCDDCDDYLESCSCNKGADTRYYACSDCESILNELFCDGYCFGQMLEALKEHIQDVGDTVLSCNMSKLTKWARDLVCDIVEAQWWDECSEEVSRSLRPEGAGIL